MTKTSFRSAWTSPNRKKGPKLLRCEEQNRKPAGSEQVGDELDDAGHGSDKRIVLCRDLGLSQL